MRTEMVTRVADAIERRTIPWLGFNMMYTMIGMSEEQARDLEIEGFMGDWTGRHCGTVGCIAGWTIALGRGMVESDVPEREMSSSIFDEAAELLDLSEENAETLFYAYGSEYNLHQITDEQAVRVLRHLARTGEVRWSIINDE